MLGYVLVEQRFGCAPLSSARARWATVSVVAGCLIFTIVATLLTTEFREFLPAFVQHGRFTLLTQAGLLPVIGLIDLAALGALVLVMRGRTVTPLWLSLAVLASLFESVMGLMCQRFSFGWYTSKLFAVASSSFVLGAFVYEFVGLSRRLATVNGELQRLNALEQQQARERIDFLANHDPVTGLANRAGLKQQLRTEILAARRSGSQLALLFVDIDRFKDINDAFGRATGDGVLIEVANRLRTTLRRIELVARVDSDKFAAALGGLAAPSDAEPIASRLRTVLAEPLSIGDRMHYVTASIGIAVCPEDGKTSTSLLDRAQAAVRSVKRDGGNGQQYFNSQIAERMRLRRLCHEGLRRALDYNEFVLHYQPLLDLQSGNIESAEALVRWQNPASGLVPPNEFIPVAEETGLMRPLGRWVLETALREARCWRDKGRPLRIAVNVSATQFHDPAFVQYLREALSVTNTEPKMLEIEVTESVAMADIAGNAVLRQCKGLGVGISLDDFGTHFSSLAYLKRLPIDTIKIDRSFVKELPFNPDDAAIVRAIVAMGQSLNRRIVAEGVENADQLEWLKQVGCNSAQGYFIARPMPSDAWDEWAANRHARTHAPVSRRADGA